MNELFRSSSAMTFASFCDDITQHDGSSFEFKLKHNFHRGNRIEKDFRIQEIDGILMLSDKGTTLANLNDIFELKEPAVIKNIVMILKEFNIQKEKEGGAFFYTVDPSKDTLPQILEFLQGIHFLYDMRLFYI